MHATLNRVSLVTEIDVPFRPPDRQRCTDPAHFDVELSRVLLHEATHYWQPLSSPALLMMAGDDWGRLLEFERTGSVDASALTRTELGNPDPTYGFSVHDLVECLSR